MAYSEQTSAGYRLRELPPEARPQERLELLGADKLSDVELLAMLLRSGNKEQNVLQISSSLLNRAGSLYRLVQWSKDDFRQIRGIGKVKALQLRAFMELFKRMEIERIQPPEIVDNPDKVIRHLQPLTVELEVEKFWMLALNRKNHLLRKCELTSGTASASLIHPREAFREAIRLNASAVIFAHNHPSGDPSPSSADIRVTQQLREASRILDIDLLDHVVIGIPGLDPRGVGYYSFSESGLLS